MIPEWCPQWAWDGAAKIDLPRLSPLERMYTRKEIARALLDAHQRGRREGMEEAAEICNERGIQEQDGFGLGREAQNYYRARDAIRTKAQEVKT